MWKQHKQERWIWRSIFFNKNGIVSYVISYKCIYEWLMYAQSDTNILFF